MKRWRQFLRMGRDWSPTAVRLVGGEPFTKDRELQQTVRYYGHADAVEYLKDLLDHAQAESHGELLTSLELGELRRADLQRLRALLTEYTVGIVTFDPTIFDTALLWNAPTMAPPRRLALLQLLAQLRIPTNVSLLIGVGECESSRLQTLAALAEIHAQAGTIQTVRIHPFSPQAGTPLEDQKPPSEEIVLRTIRQATEIVEGVPVQVSPFAVEPYLERCLDAGASDLGPIAWNPLRTPLAEHLVRWGEIVDRLEAKGLRLLERLPLTEAAVGRGLYVTSQRGPIAKQLDAMEGRAAQPVASPETQGAEIVEMDDTAGEAV
jgi:2-iminoacetate synthase ThiH